MSSAGAALLTALEYPDLRVPAPPGPERARMEQVPAGPTEAQVQQRVAAAVAEAIAACEARLRKELAAEREAAAALHAGRLAECLRQFATEQRSYFERVEMEVVQLSMAIARKVLGREAQADPTLMRALVRVAIEGFEEGAKVTLRVPEGQLERWRQAFAAAELDRICQLAADTTLQDEECMLETAVGSAQFGVEVQLKEIERGFFDLLAMRPAAS